jgi:hypothetical protein
VVKPGQLYDANMQCTLMHGSGYTQVTPRQDHYDGICHMMWCGQTSFGRIITSHPALEGTFCGPSKWCQLGRCVPWTGYAPPVTTIAPTLHPVPVYTTTTPIASVAVPTRIDGQWSSWSALACQQCSCPSLVGAIGVTLSSRSCSNPAPVNGGAECSGSPVRAVICNRKCPTQTVTVNQHISGICAEHKRIKNDEELTGTGSQLNRFPQRACKVFCDVTNRSGQKNYRFFGDNLPNGTPCGWDKYCLGGECLPKKYFWKDCIRKAKASSLNSKMPHTSTEERTTATEDTSSADILRRERFFQRR